MKLRTADIRSALQAHNWIEMPALPGRKNDQRAGILVPLIERDGELCVLLTKRATTLREHPGEISFPGGRKDPEDRTLADTALREASEECGIETAELLGRLSSIPLYTSDYRLEPWVGQIPEGSEFVVNADEVARLIFLSCDTLLQRPSLLGIEWELGGKKLIAPVFETDDDIIFGGTAYALHELLVVLSKALGQPIPPFVCGKYSWSDVLP